MKARASSESDTESSDGGDRWEDPAWAAISMNQLVELHQKVPLTVRCHGFTAVFFVVRSVFEAESSFGEKFYLGVLFA